MNKFLMILLFFSCTKVELLRLPSTVSTGLKSIELTSDTTVNGIWDGAGKVITIHNYKIHGSGTFQNWDIDASVNQQIFDSSLNLKNIKVSNGPFSTAWYGANPLNPDNFWNIQKSINVCMQNHLPCFTPNGTYKYSKPLEIKSISNNAYQFCAIHFYGDASYWDQGLGTTFQYTSPTGCGLNLQLNKGSEIDHLVFKGLFQAPNTPDSVYYNTSYDKFKDASQYNCDDWYYGIAVDWLPPVNGTTVSGSTGVHIHEVTISNFTHLLVNSPNGITRNNDIMRVENLHLGDGKTGIVNGQAQEKDMVFKGVYCWGNLHTVVSIGKHGAFQAGDYSFDGANIAGHVIRCFDISAAHWYSTHIDHWFAESIATVGDFSTQIPITIDHSNFNCVYPSVIGRQILISSNATQVQFNNSIIRYYDGLSTDVWFHGYATFNNCYYGGGKIVWK